MTPPDRHKTTIPRTRRRQNRLEKRVTGELSANCVSVIHTAAAMSRVLHTPLPSHAPPFPRRSWCSHTRTRTDSRLGCVYEYVHSAPVQVLLQLPAASVHTGCHVVEPGVCTCRNTTRVHPSDKYSRHLCESNVFAGKSLGHDKGTLWYQTGRVSLPETARTPRRCPLASCWHRCWTIPQTW